MMAQQVELADTARAVEGQPFRDALNILAWDFAQVATPKHGRYVQHPMSAADGSAYEPVSA